MIKIKIHSFVDVITNSSTTIYCQCTDKTIQAAKELINILLEESGSKKTADDLFEFKLVLNEYGIDRFVNEIEDDNLDDYLKENKYEKGDTEDTIKLVEKILLDIEEGKVPKPEYDYMQNENGYNQEDLLITPKGNPKNTINLVEKVKNIFEIDGSYDG